MLQTPIYKCEKFNPIEKLKGINYLYKLYNKEYDKYIYLLGDPHTLETSCPPYSSNVVNLIEQTIKFNPSKMIDIFLEEGFPEKESIKSFTEGGNPYSSLGEVNLFLQDCLSKNKKNCQYKNIRAHYTNIRNKLTYSLIHDIYKLYNLIYYFIQYQKMMKFKHLEEQAFISIKQNYRYITRLHKNLEKDLKKEIKLLFDEDFFKIQKQINNINIDYVKNILNIHYSKIKEQFNMIKNVLEFLIYVGNITKNYDYFITEISKKGTDIISNSIFELFSKMVDIYTIARMFRKFSDNSSPKYIIDFHGYIHTRNILNILEELKFIKLYDNSSSGEIINCLDISNLRQPLFYFE